MIDGDLPPRRVTSARLHLAHRTLPILATRFQAPASYTGQDTIEIQLPASPPLIERVIEAFIAHGTRQAEPGEFSARAYLNGKLTLADAEGVGAMIAARTESQLRTARLLLSGDAGREFSAWGDTTARLLALVEAGIDFTDQEDVIAIAPADLAAQIDTLDGAIDARLSRSSASTPRSQPLVALVGEPNAGKSTLFNALLGRTRVVTSDQAGTTRDTIIEPLNLREHAGPEILLADLTGLDANADTPLALGAQASAKDTIARADVLVICDPTGRFAEVVFQTDRPTVRVRTKADLPGADASPGPEGVLGVCSLDGWNLASVARAIGEAAESTSDAESDLIPRHKRVLESARENLLYARELIDIHARSLVSAELVAGELRLALDLLGELGGRITPDDVIGRVFSSFCVGK